MRTDLSVWRSWPLLAAGIAILAGDVALLVSDGDQAIAAGLLLGVGAVMTGAGIANVLRHPVRYERDGSSREHPGD